MLSLASLRVSRPPRNPDTRHLVVQEWSAVYTGVDHRRVSLHVNATWARSSIPQRLPFFFFFPFPPASPPPAAAAGAPAAGVATTGGVAVPSSSAPAAAATGRAFADMPDIPLPNDPSICTRRLTSAALQVLYLRHTPLWGQKVLRISLARGDFASVMGVSASSRAAPVLHLLALRALEEEAMWYFVVTRVCGNARVSD